MIFLTIWVNTMVAMMAMEDVSEKLTALEEHVSELHSQVSFHNKLHEQNSETLVQVKDILLEQVRAGEQIKHMNEKFQTVEKNSDELWTQMHEYVKSQTATNNRMIEKIDDNKAQINKWIGGLGALITAFGISVTVFKLFFNP